MITIRESTKNDANQIWEIFHAVVKRGDTYAFAPNTTKEEGLLYWMGEDKYCYVAEYDNKIAGTFIIKDNQPGLGSHISNASFMVSSKFRGKSIGKHMGQYAISQAKSLGYRGMQFNLVVATNIAALSLWQKLNFEIVGTVPNAFEHKKLGLVDAHIMYREL